MFGKFGFRKKAPTDTVVRSPAPETDHKIVLLGSKLEAAIHHIPGSGLVYMNNAKAGCSSIKKSLWMSKSPSSFTQPHDKGRSPFRHMFKKIMLDRKQFETAQVFTMVRNPYTRVLSAYLDKVATGKGGFAGSHFRNRFQVKGRIPLFSEFLELIASEEPELLDQHFAPQFYTTLHPLICYDFIGHIEELEKVGSWLDSWKIPQEEFRPHATNARQLLQQHYTAKDYDRVRAYFAADFEAFGYSDDPAVIAPIAPVKMPDIPRTNLADLVAAFADTNVKTRDAAFARLRQNAPMLELEYIRLERGLITQGEIEEKVSAVRQGDTLSWAMLERLSELASEIGLTDDADFLQEAALKRRAYRIG